MDEPLSLATFEADRAFPPYLNTPRSLEACRIHGVNPVELVEIPISEFHKDYPNDPDAAQRRFERIDGARRRVLKYVKSEWKHLCESGWKPLAKTKSVKETIVEVPIESHCTLLELQAQRFRKIEQENWNTLQRTLKMEVIGADRNLKNKMILAKHDSIQKSNEDTRKERKMMKDALIKEQIEMQKQKEEERLREIKELQELDAEYSRQKHLDQVAKEKRDKENRERRELERVQREEYTRKMKESILNGLESKINAKKKIREIRDKHVEDRINQVNEERTRKLEEKKKLTEDRLAKTREDQKKRDDEERDEMLRRLQEAEELRNRMNANRELQRKLMNETNDNAGKEKLDKILAAKTKHVQDKADRTLNDLNFKDQLAKQELDKVKEAQNKRMVIKQIREESFKIAQMRAKKAQEYRMMKLEKDLHDKEERCNAIKKGFTLLEQMRTNMKDIMEKTSTEIKHEMHLLRHGDQYDPDKVVEKALEIGDKILFPRLEKTFGIVPEETKKGPSIPQSTDLFAFNGGDSTKRLSKSMNDLQLDLHKTTTNHDDGGGIGVGGDVTGGGGGGLNNTLHRTATLPVQTFTQDRLLATLQESKEKYVTYDKMSPSNSPSNRKNKSRKGHKPRTTNNNDNSNNNQAILRLEDEDLLEDDLELIREQRDRTQQRLSRERQQQQHGRSGGRSKSPSNLRINSALTDISTQEDANFSSDDEYKQQRATSPLAQSKYHMKSRLSPYSKSFSMKESELALLPPIDLDTNTSPKLTINVENWGDGPNSGGGKNNNNKNTNTKGSLSAPTTTKSATAAGRNSSHSKKHHHKSSSTKELRTDVNDKAHYLETPNGKFRREFSLDHPLAAQGTGKYKKELKNGLVPIGMESGVKKPAANNLTETLQTAQKIERLTYSAQPKITDAQTQLEKLKKEQNDALKQIIAEEREAEEQRVNSLKAIKDDSEKEMLNSIFAEERRRASDRIIAATKEHEIVMKQAVLSIMNLGGGHVTIQ